MMGNMGAPIKAQSIMYKAIVQAVLLYGREIWVVTYSMMIVLEGFNHRIARQIAGMTVNKDNGGEWERALLDAALDTRGLWKIREYVRRQQVTIAEYVAWRPIYKLFTDADRMEGSIRFLR